MHCCFATLPCDALEIKDTLSGPALDCKVLLHWKSLMKPIIEYMYPMLISLFFKFKVLRILLFMLDDVIFLQK